MITRKTLEQATPEKGYLDAEKFDSLGDADIERLMAEDLDLAPPADSLKPLLEMRDIRQKLGLSEAQLARKLAVSVSTLRKWERGGAQSAPKLQPLLRILDRLDEPAFRALDEPLKCKKDKKGQSE
jgi:putative transcriptional regulator